MSSRPSRGLSAATPHGRRRGPACLAGALLCGVQLLLTSCADPAQILLPPEPHIALATRGIPRTPLALGDPVTLLPGDQLTVAEVDRLSAWAVTVDPPHLEPYLEIHRAGEGVMGSRLIERYNPPRLRDGQLFLQNGVEPARHYTIKLLEEAPEQASVSVVKIAPARTLHYWEHRRDQLLDALDEDLDVPVPPGMGLPGDDDAARAARHGKELIVAAGFDSAARTAARHIARAWVLREVERSRSHATRYHERRKLDGWVGTFTQRLTTERDPIEKMWSISLTEPQQVLIEGPARVDFRVRGVLPAERPDERLDFAFEILDFHTGATLHRADMSSRAAMMDLAPLATAEDEAHGDPEVYRVAPPSGVPDDERASKRVPRRLHGGDGETLTWARETSFWVPPGTHRYILNAPDASIRFDADLLKIRPQAQDRIDRKLDITYQIELARRALALAPEHVQQVFGAELALFSHDMPRAHALLTARASPLSPDAPLACWSYLRALQQLPLEPEANLTKTCLTSQQDLAERNTRLLAINTQKLIESRQFSRSLEDLSLATNPQDERLLLARALTWLEGGPTESARWFGMGLLLADWAAHPLDEERRTQTQRAWWYRSHWQRLDPDGRHARHEFLERLGPPHQLISTSRLASRAGVLFELSPSRPHQIRLEPAPDDPTRPARLRLLGAGFEPIDYHALRVDERPIELLRTAPFERLDLAVPAGLHMITSTRPRSNQSRIFSYDPPVNTPTLRASEVVERRRYARITKKKSLTWSFEPAQAPRKIRLMLRSNEALRVARLTLTTAPGIRHHLELRGAPTDLFEDASPTLTFDVPAGSGQVTLTLEDAALPELYASLEVRQVGLANPPEPLDPGVIDGLAIPEIERLEALTASIASANKEARPPLLVERATLLMLLDQEDLARVDLERVLQDPLLARDLWLEAWRLMLAVEIRMSYDWLRSPKLSAGEVMPIRLAGHVLDAPLEEPGACLDALRAYDEPRAAALGARCTTAYHYASLRHMEQEEPPDSPKEARAHFTRILTQWRVLHEAMRHHSHRWAVRAGLGSAALDLVEHDPLHAPIGIAATAYVQLLGALFEWPYASVRSGYFRALKWTGWDTLRPPARGGRKSGEIPPDDEVENLFAPHVTPPAMVDPRRDAVEFAMLGSFWRRPESFELLRGVHHTRRFVAHASGRLVVQAACQDLRPDLQPPGPSTPCGWSALLFDAEDNPIPEVASPDGKRRDTRIYQVESGQHYELRLHRLDELKGRTFFVRASISDGPPWHYGRTGVRLFDEDRPLSFDVAGPVALRLDLRSITESRRDVTSNRVRITHHDPTGATREYTLDLSTTPPTSLPFEEARPLPATSPMRHVLLLEEAGDHRIELSLVEPSPRASVGVRIAARVDDYTETLREMSGQGWNKGLDAPGLAEELVVEDEALTSAMNRALYDELVSQRLQLGELDLTPPPEHPWVAGAEAGWRARDLGGELNIQERARDRSYLYAEANGSMFWPRSNLWITPHLGTRASLGMAPTAYAGGRVTWMHDALERVRLELDARVATQRVDGDNLSSLRGFFGLQYKVDWSPRWSQRAWIRARWRPEFGPESADLDRTDPLIRSSYAADHPITYELESSWRWRPFLDAWLDLGGALRLNTNATPDQASLWAKSTMRLGQEVMVGLDYQLDPLFPDRDRDRLFLLQQLRGELEWWGWHLDQHWFALGIWGSLGAVLPSEQVLRLRAGIQLSYTFGDRGWEAIPPSQSVVKDLRQPLYFGRRPRRQEEVVEP